MGRVQTRSPEPRPASVRSTLRVREKARRRERAVEPREPAAPGAFSIDLEQEARLDDHEQRLDELEASLDDTHAETDTSGGE